MTLRHMRIYVSVCENKSVTMAAQKLFIAQPSVSLAIKELEDYYGIKLFDRISRKLYITDQGKRFLNYATHIVSLFDEMEQGIKNSDQVGALKIGSSITIGNYLVPQCTQLFNEKHPQMKVQVIINNSEEIEKLVMRNEIDFGLIEGIVHNVHIQEEKFMEDELVLICGGDHPLSGRHQVEVEELKQQDFILREKGSGGRELFDSTMLVHNIEISPVWESVSTQAIVKAVSRGLGISILPYLLVKQDLDEGNIEQVKIKDLSFHRFFNIIYHKNKFLTQSAKDFVEICKNQQYSS